VTGYQQLAPLRLRSFLPTDRAIDERGGFEWMNGFWLYEGIGFTWFGRLETSPDATAGLELYFEELPRDSLEQILRALALPLVPGMTARELEQVLGPIHQTHAFVADRKTYSFRVGDPDAYEVGCTVHNERGLIHLSVIRHDVAVALLSPDNQL